jgi:hypothetical protein
VPRFLRAKGSYPGALAQGWVLGALQRKGLTHLNRPVRDILLQIPLVFKFMVFFVRNDRINGFNFIALLSPDFAKVLEPNSSQD